jgi:hypothetical protein
VAHRARRKCGACRKSAGAGASDMNRIYQGRVSGLNCSTPNGRLRTFRIGAFRRRSVMRRGSSASVAPYLTPGIAEPTLSSEPTRCSRETEAIRRRLMLRSTRGSTHAMVQVRCNRRAKYLAEVLRAKIQRELRCQSLRWSVVRPPAPVAAGLARGRNAIDSAALYEFDANSIAIPIKSTPNYSGPAC